MKNKKPESVTKLGPEQNIEKTHEGRAAIAEEGYKEKEQSARESAGWKSELRGNAWSA